MSKNEGIPIGFRPEFVNDPHPIIGNVEEISEVFFIGGSTILFSNSISLEELFVSASVRSKIHPMR